MKPLLTIAIPTYNRSTFLEENLRRLKKQYNQKVDILICDNASIDQTEMIVQKYINSGLPIRYYRNEENLGWERNFELCFRRANGIYTMLLGDDDFIMDGGLSLILSSIEDNKTDLLFCRAFGFDTLPSNNKVKFKSIAKAYSIDVFLKKTVLQFRLLSSYVLKSEYINSNVNFKGNFAHLYVVFNVLLNGDVFSILDEKIIACKKDNSDFDQKTNFSDVYMKEFFELYREFLGDKVSQEDNQKVEKIMLLEYYPKYIFKMRIKRIKKDPNLRKNFDLIFKEHESYKFFRMIFLNENIITTSILFFIILYHQIIYSAKSKI